jgi:glucose-1-phosphate thymidylyltransferase
MKAVILCAGIGKRLRPFSHSTPKHLLPVCNIPVLQYLLDELSLENRVKEVALIVSKETIDPIRDFLVEKTNSFSFQFTFLLQDIPMGLAHACSMAEVFVDGEDFIMLLGDNIIPGGCHAILSSQKEIDETNDAVLLVRKVMDPKPYGVVEFDREGNILSMEEKPINPKSDYVIVGIYRFKPCIFESIRQIKPSLRGEYEITDAIFHLKSFQKNVKAKIFDGIFLDIGNPQSYLAANQYMIENLCKEPPIDSSSSIRGSFLEKDVSIGKHVTINDSKLSNCIVLPGTHIEYSNLKNSIIGKNSFISINNQCGEALELILGDDSKICH